ncbi:chemotaxis-specific protein-glutamate methyltransferase CheB [bacterium]|nr:MAG: chemotaxis-specific protein-glutamate methyltransferase CheB [bacterium]
MIKVLIVEDSRVAQEFLAHVLSSDPAIQVVGLVDDGDQALLAVREKHPDVVTMDIHMPKMDGFQTTHLIMEKAPVPIVIVSASTGAKDVASMFQALEAGALAVVLLPPGFGHPEHQAAVQELLRTVKMMSEIKVVRRFGRAVNAPPPAKPGSPVLPARREIQMIAIGTSTGGPPVLQKILSLLPGDLPVPLLIVQHITSGFTEGFVEWLSGASGFPLHIAAHGQTPLPGHGYVAPENFHLGIASGPLIVLSNHAPENGLRPSVAYLFHTVAQVLGSHAVGVLLTGMGRDGARELKEMRDRGALTIAQDEASSIVHGMPGEAIKLEAAMFVLAPEAIATMLKSLVGKTNGGSG